MAWLRRVRRKRRIRCVFKGVISKTKSQSIENCLNDGCRNHECSRLIAACVVGHGAVAPANSFCVNFCIAHGVAHTQRYALEKAGKQDRTDGSKQHHSTEPEGFCSTMAAFFTYQYGAKKSGGERNRKGKTQDANRRLRLHRNRHKEEARSICAGIEATCCKAWGTATRVTHGHTRQWHRRARKADNTMDAQYESNRWTRPKEESWQDVQWRIGSLRDNVHLSDHLDRSLDEPAVLHCSEAQAAAEALRLLQAASSHRFECDSFRGPNAWEGIVENPGHKPGSGP